MKDLDRIPPPYRERVQRLCRSAFVATGPHAAAAALAPFLAIADEADAAAGDGLRYGLDTATTTIDAQTARADVWARRMAEHGEHHDCPACTAQTAAMRAADEAAEAADTDAPPAIEKGDAAQAVRSAQQAHLKATRAQAIEPGVHVTLHAFPDGSQELHVHTPTGLRLTVDGLVRYLADKPIDALRAVVALMKTLPVSLGGQIDLGSRNRLAHDIIAALPGAIAQETTCRDGVRLAYALAEIDGIEIAARYNPEPAEVP